MLQQNDKKLAKEESLQLLFTNYTFYVSAGYKDNKRDKIYMIAIFFLGFKRKIGPLYRYIDYWANIFRHLIARTIREKSCPVIFNYFSKRL